MKLRIRGDSLRLRLTRAEVTALANQGRVEETTVFGSSRLTYALSATLAPEAKLTAKLEGTRIEVAMSKARAQAWAESDEVGLEGDQPGGTPDEARTLRILIEKDFACLTKRPGEDDTDAYPNPSTSCASPTSGSLKNDG
jgi:hypothetical protein